MMFPVGDSRIFECKFPVDLRREELDRVMRMLDAWREGLPTATS